MLLNFPLSSKLRNIFEPVVYSQGRALRKYWKYLEKTQFLSETQLKELQWQRLKNILDFVWENNQFYRDRFQSAGITPANIDSPDALRLLPILTKEEIRLNTPIMISNGFETSSLQQFKTGGSTGKALTIYATEECSYLRNACTRRHDRWTGWEVGEPMAAVWGNPHMPVTFKDKLKHWLLTPYIYLDTMSVSEESIRFFASEWERGRPTLLFGHSHSIYNLAEFVRDLKLTSIRPKGILSTSMMLMPHERRTIESVFGVKVTDRYGCEEVSLIASECEKHEGMHLNIEHLFIEFIKDDGSSAYSSEQGMIVVTDLMNCAMPFIRYKVEDVGVPTDRKCSCGRGLPLMESVSGRVADFLIKQDGSRVAGVSLIENTLTKIPGIAQMQIIQEAIDQIVVLIVPGCDYQKSTNLELSAYFRKVFGESVAVDLKKVSAIKSEATGKYRFSVCNILR